MVKISDLKILRKACLEVAGPEWSCYPEYYDANKSPLDGHCGAVSSMLRGIYGGDIVTGRVNGAVHYWNRLPGGIEIDLTSCQFGGDGYNPLLKGRKVKRGKLVNLRFLQFAELVRQKLGSQMKLEGLRLK